MNNRKVLPSDVEYSNVSKKHVLLRAIQEGRIKPLQPEGCISREKHKQNLARLRNLDQQLLRQDRRELMGLDDYAGLNDYDPELDDD